MVFGNVCVSNVDEFVKFVIVFVFIFNKLFNCCKYNL